MPWQQVAIVRSLEVAEGRPWRHVGIVAGRGNGKSAVTGAIAFAHLEAGRSVLIIAHNLATAKEAFDVVDATIENDVKLLARRRRVLRGKGDARIVLAHATGNAVLRIAASARSCRGPRAHTIVADESGEIRADVWSAARYVQQGLGAGVVPQDIRLGTVPGDPDSDSPLSQLRAQAVLGDPDTLWMEWSIPSEADPTDESWWPLAVPALGYRVDLDEVRQEVRADPRTAAVELLSRWPTTAVTRRIPEDRWIACGDPLQPRPDPGDLWLGVDLDAEDRDRAAIVAAWHDGPLLRVELLDIVPLPDLHDWLDRCRGMWDPRSVTFDPYVAQSLAADSPNPSWWQPVGVRDLTSACARILDRVTAGTLAHRPDPRLDLAAAADVRPVGGAWAFRRTPTTTPLIAAALAGHGATQAPATLV
jgi:hypothetical protein